MQQDPSTSARVCKLDEASREPGSVPQVSQESISLDPEMRNQNVNEFGLTTTITSKKHTSFSNTHSLSLCSGWRHWKYSWFRFSKHSQWASHCLPHCSLIFVILRKEIPLKTGCDDETLQHIQVYGTSCHFAAFFQTMCRICALRFA